MNITEVLVILLVALLVIKPERLPDTALKLGRFIKWAHQTIAKIKQDIAGPLDQLQEQEKKFFRAHQQISDDAKK